MNAYRRKLVWLSACAALGLAAPSCGDSSDRGDSGSAGTTGAAGAGGPGAAGTTAAGGGRDGERRRADREGKAPSHSTLWSLHRDQLLRGAP
jgi:hypothetical protein